MVQCQFCNSGTRDNYIYTECDHLICLQCSCAKWDRKYSIKCCNKTTFLEEQTCFTLQKLNRQEETSKKYQCKENIPLSITLEKMTEPSKIHDQQQFLKRRDIQESIYLGDGDKVTNKPESTQRRKENHLEQMELVMNENLNRIKFVFEIYRKELEKKQESLLRSVYNKYSEHLNSLSSSVTDEDTKQLKDTLNHLISQDLNKLTLRQAQCKQDKVIEKLEYNQQKMKEKLHRHYQLLK